MPHLLVAALRIRPTRSGYTPEEAQDLTQGFFAWLLERRDLETWLRREKGRLRSYLARVVKKFSGEDEAIANSQ